MELLASSLGVRDRVRFTGYDPDPAEVMADTSIVVVPSRFEPFGLVVVEAMASGCAVVAAEVGGPAERIEHDRTGLLFPAGDPVALARALKALLLDPGRRENLAASGKAFVTDRFSADDMAAIYAQTYASVLSHN